jgi:CDP-paratose 2-epimerase
VAHFLRAALMGEPVTIYGTGRQVRDLLFVSDLVDAFVAARECMGALTGRAFNLGGGPRHTASLLEILDFIEHQAASAPEVKFAETRLGDQPWYVSDTSAFTAATGWRARVSVREGLYRLMEWLQEWTGQSWRPAEQQRETQACASP